MTGAVVRFDVIGDPAPQGSKSAVTRRGRTMLVEGKTTGQRVKHRAWRDAVAWASRAASRGIETPLDGPLHVSVEFRIRRPKSRPRGHHGWHTVTPDKDKLLRSTLDGMTDGGLIADDARACAGSWSAIEVTEWIGAVITVTQITTPAPTGQEAKP